MKIWECKVGEVDESKLPQGADFPMRQAVEQAYQELTGEAPEFVFSGWGAELTEGERAAHEGRLPAPSPLAEVAGPVTEHQHVRQDPRHHPYPHCSECGRDLPVQVVS